MKVKIGGLQLFRNSLYRAAARSLQEKHPQYVETLIQTLAETSDLSQALDTVKAIPTDIGFAKWRPLLTATLDTELAINQLRVTLELLRLTPSKGLLIPEGTEGTLVLYYTNVWVLLADALLERSEKLIKKAARTLIRPSNPKWQSIEDEVSKPINELSKDLRSKMRNPLAHGGGAVEAPAEERLWEGFTIIAAVTNRYELFFSQMLGAMAKYHATWYERLSKHSVLMLNEINRAINNLNKHINWDKT